MALRTFISLTADQLTLLAEVLEDVLPCGRGPLQRSIVDRVKIKSKAAKEIVETLGIYLLKAVPGGPLHGKVWDKLLGDFQSHLNGDELDAVRQQEELYTRIFSDHNAIALKGALLQQRVIPHIARFESVVDLRPVFDDKHASVLAFVPVVILQLTLHSENCDTFANHSFQLTPDSLKNMLKTLEDAQDKMTVLVSSLKTLEPKVLE